MMDAADFLEELVSIPSPSGAEDAAVGYLVDRMAELGFRAQRDEAGNAVGVLGRAEAECTIVLLGHIDTVPGFLPVRREGGVLYGRGTVDAKGPLAAFVLAAARVAPSLPDARLVVIGAVEEESRSRGAHHLVRTISPPDGVIIGEPSGWQGITLGYKGVMRIGYRLAQPAGHSAGDRPSPAEKALTFWNRLAAYAQENNRGAKRRFNTLDPALRTISTFSDGIEERVEMEIVLRLPIGISQAGLQRELRNWAGGAELEFPYTEPPFRAEKNIPPVRALLRSIRAAGGRPRFKLKTGTSDMNVVGPAWGCPIVAYGPGDSALDHAPDEHIDLVEFNKGIEILARALEIWAGEVCGDRRAG